MPIAKVRLPDGRIGRFNVPEGTTPEQDLNNIKDEIKAYEKIFGFSTETMRSRVVGGEIEECEKICDWHLLAELLEQIEK